MEDYRQKYLKTQKDAVNKMNEERFEKRGKVDDKMLEFFKGINQQVKGLANQIEAQGYDTNSMTKLEELLSNFNYLYNIYAQEIVRKPENKLSVPMRQIMDALKNTLMRLSQISPNYGRLLSGHLKNLDEMYVKTGGSVFIKGVPTPAHLRGGSLGRFTDNDNSYNYDYYEPTFLERLAQQKNIERYPDYVYSKPALNEDYN